MVSIDLTEEEAEQFKQFRKFQSMYEKIPTSWQQVVDYSAKMQHGSFNLVIQNGLPVRIDRPMQKVVIGILTK